MDQTKEVYKRAMELAKSSPDKWGNWDTIKREFPDGNFDHSWIFGACSPSGPDFYMSANADAHRS